MVKIWEILFLQHLHTLNCSFSSQAGLEITKMYAQAQLYVRYTAVPNCKNTPKKSIQEIREIDQS